MISSMKILGQREWASEVYYFSFSTSKRGVAILIIKNTLFSLDKYIKGKNGPYVLITGGLHGEHITIGCIYALNVYIR